MTAKTVFSVDLEIRWRDLIALEIPNVELKKRVEIFLNLLEKSAFSYQFNDVATGQSEERFFSGQDLLKRMADVRKNLGVWLQEHQGSRIAEYFAGTSVVKSGRFVISQHNRSFQDIVVNGTQTMFVGNPTIGAYPIGFEIGTDYLKGTKYHGVDKKLHPVTVDAAVVHELTHIAYNTSDEEIPILVERIVTSALGAVKRQDGAHNIVYSKGSNGGFWLLSRNIKDGGRLGDEFADRVRSDFSAIEDSGYDFTKAIAAFEFTPVK